MLKQIDLNFEGMCFHGSIASYHIALLCAIAYYGDGRLSKEELIFIEDIAVSLTKPDIPDKELCAREELLLILDSLRDALIEVEDKHVAANDIVELFASKIVSQVSQDRNTLTALIGHYEELSGIDGELGKGEALLISKIKSIFGIRTLAGFFAPIKRLAIVIGKALIGGIVLIIAMLTK